jgi:hypothetical protein
MGPNGSLGSPMAYKSKKKGTQCYWAFIRECIIQYVVRSTRSSSISNTYGPLFIALFGGHKTVEFSTYHKFVFLQAIYFNFFSKNLQMHKIQLNLCL